MNTCLTDCEHANIVITSYQHADPDPVNSLTELLAWLCSLCLVCFPLKTESKVPGQTHCAHSSGTHSKSLMMQTYTRTLTHILCRSDTRVAQFVQFQHIQCVHINFIRIYNIHNAYIKMSCTITWIFPRTYVTLPVSTHVYKVYAQSKGLPARRTNTKTHMLVCTHLTLIETTGWRLSPLTGSIRGQSAAEPHAVQPQRDTLDYRGTARHTMEEGWGLAVAGLGG